MSKSYLIIVLHAHIPYVFDSSQEGSLEERWLYEAFIDSYLRLIQVFDKLIANKVPFRLTLSFSPILLAQMENPKVGIRFVNYLKDQIALAEKEIKRTRHISELSLLSEMYKGLYEEALKTFEERCEGDFIKTFKSFQEKGVIEIITCPATHPYLPLLRPSRSGINAQINLSIKEYNRLFKGIPSGLWIPECGYFPGLDLLLKQSGINFTFLDTETIRRSKPRPKYGTYHPVSCPSGVVAFGRDVHTAKQVWSIKDGYPGDSDYRDFYRDIGFDIHGDRSYTGFKYYRIESHNDQKMVYNSERAMRKLAIHADDFIAHRLDQMRRVAGVMDSSPVMCAFYDAELFGHWWFEGPLWLQILFEKIAECSDYLTTTTPSLYLQQNPRLETTCPMSGSWGWKGYHEVWLNSKNKWIYPHLFKAGEKMEEIARRGAKNSLEERVLNQAGKELMLAQSSDWAFILHTNSFSEYAARRVKEHIGRFWRLTEELESGSINEESLIRIEDQDNIFPSLSYKDFLLLVK